MLSLTWYGHATWMVEIGGTKLLIDPFFNGNPMSPVRAEEVCADFIVVTHGHGDHLGDTVALARRCGAMVISNFEIINWLRQQGLEKLHAQHIGGGFHYPFGYLKLTQAVHGSSLPDGSYGGMPAGILLRTEAGTIYHAGDTGLFAGMELIGEEGIDAALLPIGDNYTMGPEDALRAIRLLHPRLVFPMHYDTWPPIAQDVQAWAERVEAETDAEPVVLQPGGRYRLN